MLERILIYGMTGSGKTTLAAEIGNRTGVPYHLVDDLTWEPGWVPVPVEEQRRRIEAICAGDRWILDTAYTAWLDEPLARAQLIVALDYPRWRSLARLVRRSVVRVATQRLVCNGNVESLKKLRSKDSIVVWHFRTFAAKRSRMRAWAMGDSGPPVVRLRSPRATRDWISTLSSGASVRSPS